MTRDEYLARWGKAAQWPQTEAELEEWQRDIEAVKANNSERDSVID